MYIAAVKQVHKKTTTNLYCPADIHSILELRLSLIVGITTERIFTD